MTATTRSQSGNLPKRRKSLTETLEEDKEHDSGVTTSSAKRRKLNGAPPPKGTSASAPRAPRRKVRGSLKNMLTLPLDALFEIFSRIQPADLLSLARTSKDLRGVLMSRKSTSIWMAARRNADVAAVPDPPEWLSEPAWAHLLFGPEVCGLCHSNRDLLMDIDFMFFQRYCVNCSLEHFIEPSKLHESMPQLKKSVLRFVPTDMKFLSIGPTYLEWRLADIYEVSQRLSVLEEDVASGKSGAQEALESFHMERLVLVASMTQKAKECLSWKKQVDGYEMRKMFERRKAMTDRLIAAGYTLSDIDNVGISKLAGVGSTQELTDKEWDRIKDRVEARIISKRARLEARRK